ncbi:MAG: hypothetical protein DCC71_10780 [Proteobacteria bacterium]|nr:MAG: hypothetical protein DCC71_10780 [Pseudomonadota bacterium]
MSHLIRNVLEDTFQLVDDVVANVDGIVNESVELARRVGRDARRVADAVRDAVAELPDDADEEAALEDGEEPIESERRAGEAADPLAHVYAWNAVVLNRAATCARCAAPIARGGDGFVGLSDDPRAPRTWLCPACRESL